MRPPSTDRLIFTSVTPIGATFVPATSQVTVCAEPPVSGADVDCEVTRNGPASGSITSRVSADPTPPAPGFPSRAVSLKFSVRSFRNPTHAFVGRNSEKQSRTRGGSAVGGAGPGGHVPVTAFVLLARICARSGNTRVGSVVTAFRPGDGVRSVPSGVTSAATPNWRKSGPFAFVLLTSPVPAVPPRSVCSHM